MADQRSAASRFWFSKGKGRRSMEAISEKKPVRSIPVNRSAATTIPATTTHDEAAALEAQPMLSFPTEFLSQPQLLPPSLPPAVPPSGMDSHLPSTENVGRENSHSSQGEAKQEPDQMGVQQTSDQSTRPNLRTLHSSEKENESVVSTQIEEIGVRTAMEIRSTGCIITLAGDNRGASMHISSDQHKSSDVVHIQRDYKKSLEEDDLKVTTNEESDRDRTKLELQSSSKKVCINSNNQGANNSILFNSCVSPNDPGVQLVYNQTKGKDEKLTNTGEKDMDGKKQALMVIRRRCLRGLLGERSSGDEDNLNKPKRHGCPYSCGHKGK